MTTSKKEKSIQKIILRFDLISNKKKNINSSRTLPEHLSLIPPKKSSTEYGRFIEENAKLYLSQFKEMQFISQNINIYGRFKKGEIDLIYYDQKEKSLVFIEVRARWHYNLYGHAEESLGGMKRFHLKTAIEWYFRRNRNKLPHPLNGIRIDLMAFNGERFNWIKNISL